jgi:hypothetical protein
MKVLKGFGLAILGFLLFMSLSVFGIAFTINSTLLNPDFVVSEVDKINISKLVTDLTEENLGQFPEERQFLNVAIKGAIYKVLSDQEPWLKEQVNKAIYSSYDYFLGRSEKLNVVISLEPLKERLGDSLKQAIIQSLPPEAGGLTPAQIERYLDPYYQEFIRDVSSDISFDESLIPPDAMEKIVEIRLYIGYFQTGYKALIGFMVLLVLGIVLISRNIRGATHGLGTDFLIYGALEFAGFYIARNYALTNLPMILPKHGIASFLQPWLLELSRDLLAPLQMFSLGLLIVGVILLVVSFVYKSSPAED